MRAVVFDAHGAPADVLRCEERPDATPGPGQVVVALEAAAIHPADLLTVQGQYASGPKLPGAVPGLEGVGRILVVGPGADAAVGDRVILPLGQGAWRDQLVVSAARLDPAPERADAGRLALALVNPATAHLLLESLVRLVSGEWILQSAANGSVGRLVAWFAHERGVRTINVVRSLDRAKALRAGGADVIVEDGPDLAAEIARYTNRAPIRLAVDAVGGATAGRLASALTHGGTLVSYGAMAGRPISLLPSDVIFRDVRLMGFWLTTWLQQATEAKRRDLVARMVGRAAAGDVPLDVAATFPLDRIHDAVAAAEAPGRGGKILLTGQAWTGS